MKNLLIIILSFLLFTSCSRSNPEIKQKLNSDNIERIVITNTRYAGRYTIIDKKAIARFKNKVLKAKKADIDPKLEPDFIFNFYSENKKIASFKYIAKINDEGVANLIDEEGRLLNVSTSIEDEFIKRLLKTQRNENVPEYYIDSISLIIEKINAKNSTIAIDLKKEVMTLKYLTSMDIKGIFDSISKNGVKVVLKEQAGDFDYLISINTRKFSGKQVETEITVTDKNGFKTAYKLEGVYKDKWEFFIAYK